MESPGALEYSPDETLILTQKPAYSFGPPAPKDRSEQKTTSRMALPLTSTPRVVGPGSHMQPSAMGAQPCSARSSAPSWGFGSSQRSSSVRGDRGPLIGTSAELGSIGQQCVSSARNAPKYGFGTATREHIARTGVVQNDLDKGPTARLPKVKFHLDLPKPEKRIPRHGF